MSKRANPTVIGGFVLGALVLVIIAILVFSSGALLRERIRIVTYFPGSVQGLNVGSQVLFQGVPIGQVTQIGVDYVPERESFRIPVHYEIWPQNVHVLGSIGEADARDVLQRLVDEKGLRARLDSVSFVTGQYVVTLSLSPDLPKRDYAVQQDGPIRVPAIAATRDRVEEMLENLQINELVDTATETLAAVRDLAESSDLRETVERLNATLAQAETMLSNLDRRLASVGSRADETLTEYRNLATGLQGQLQPLAGQLQATAADIADLARGLDAGIAPLSEAALEALQETGAAMRAVSGLAGEGSGTRHELDRLLAEATRAARSLRTLTDYLERHPEALLQGKR
ncbi:MAG: MlaD family protein [Thiohalocapsa sp.]|nr:MlaD family protein [Thiohalocapsa sp.]